VSVFVQYEHSGLKSHPLLLTIKGESHMTFRGPSMLVRPHVVVLACFVVLLSGAAAMAEGPTLFLLEAFRLDRTKNRIFNHSDPLYMPAYNTLISNANSEMHRSGYHVMQKTATPPSGDKHDYMSIAALWWPTDPNDLDAPWERRDGQVNPMASDGTYDPPRGGEMGRLVMQYGTAYYFTGNEAYADKAAVFVRRWFLNEATKMNPNLNFAQGIPGAGGTPGRQYGTIDTRNFIRVLDAVGMIQGSSHWTATDQQALTDWFTQYHNWFTTSTLGVAARKEHNNIATWYDAQVVAYALFTGQKSQAREHLLNHTLNRIGSQFTTQGVQTHEVARVSAWSYSVMNLEGFFTLASLAKHAGVDLWNYTTHDGKSIKKALDYLVSFVDNPSAWPHQTSSIDLSRLTEMLLPLAYQHYGEIKYLEAFEAIQGDDVDVSIARLLFHNSIPEPTSLALLGAGALLVLRRRRA